MSSTAATTAALAPPAVSSTEAAAICAEPAKVVTEKTSGASHPMPALRARIPNVTANRKAALEELRVLRATVRELVLATINGTDLRPETVNRLNAFAARAARAPQLVLTAAGPRHTEHAPGAPVDRLLSESWH